MEGRAVLRTTTLVTLLLMGLETSSMKSTTKPSVHGLLSFFPFITEWSQAAQAADVPPTPLEANQYIKDIFLLGEISQEDKDYLGFGRQEPTLCNVSCEFVLVQMFSIYCPQCQRLAPTFNSLYALINGDPACRKNLKMIGIGAGNNNYEVQYYREFYKVSFPVFSDPQFTIHRMLHEPRTPFVFLCKTESDKVKILSILDPSHPPQDQLKRLKASLNRTIASSEERSEDTNEIMLIKNNCHLCNSPNGEAIACLLKGTKVRKLETVGNWCKIEMLVSSSNLQGWLRIE
jgi:thiol-disulfide isomerase/thioredoxin